MSDFLDALRRARAGLRRRVRHVGAGPGPRPDDFGGPALEGCNEHLVLTRPDLIRQMHREYFEVGVDAVETATFGAFGTVLAEYGIAEQTFTHQRAGGAHRQGGGRRVLDARSGPAS